MLGLELGVEVGGFMKGERIGSQGNISVGVLDVQLFRIASHPPQKVEKLGLPSVYSPFAKEVESQMKSPVTVPVCVADGIPFPLFGSSLWRAYPVRRRQYHGRAAPIDSFD